MPIRFRCAYCNQLMAISRRKEGSVVRCPKCAGDIVVPSLEGTPAANEEAGPPDPQVEEQDAGHLDFAPTVKAPSEKSAAASTAPPTAPAPPSRRGIFLSLGMLFLLLGISLLFCVLTFVIGLVVGRSMPAG